MRATGIVRRMDDLGRVVIPKEVRKNLHIREGDPLELYILDNAVVFKKYKSNSSDELFAIASAIKDDVYMDESIERRSKIFEIANQIHDIAKTLQGLEEEV